MGGVIGQHRERARVRSVFEKKAKCRFQPWLGQAFLKLARLRVARSRYGSTYKKKILGFRLPFSLTSNRATLPERDFLVFRPERRRVPVSEWTCSRPTERINYWPTVGAAARGKAGICYLVTEAQPIIGHFFIICQEVQNGFLARVFFFRELIPYGRHEMPVADVRDME